MRVAVFSSRGPNNFLTALHAGRKTEGKFSVCLVVTDRFNIPVIPAAAKFGIPVITTDFLAPLRNVNPAARRALSEHLHDEMLQKIRDFEISSGSVDICVLAYRRIIAGDLLQYFRDRMINQHPADLTVIDSETGLRRFVGIGGLEKGLRDGVSFTRTSTIVVSEGMDTGEILVQGPQVAVSVPINVQMHEQIQKEQSDSPALERCLNEIASGSLRIGRRKWPDGCRQINLDKTELPYGGLQLGDSY